MKVHILFYSDGLAVAYSMAFHIIPMHFGLDTVKIIFQGIFLPETAHFVLYIYICKISGILNKWPIVAILAYVTYFLPDAHHFFNLTYPSY